MLIAHLHLSHASFSFTRNSSCMQLESFPMNCTPLVWSTTTADALSPTVIVCAIALIGHTIFWFQLLLVPTLRERSMMWLYAYLATDYFLLIRFFIFYSLRKEEVCLYPTFRTILCYFEASSKFYINAVQTYLLLALNACRYAQIVSNKNLYLEYPRWLIVSFGLITFLPALNVLVQFLAGWTELWRRTGGSCDIQYRYVIVQIFNLFVVYLIPIILSLAIIGLCIRHVSSIVGIRSQQIINRRRQHQRTLLFQTIIFYSTWLILWSPNVLAFQFINVNTTAGIITSFINYIELTLDPLVIAALDVRFFKVWQTLWRKLRGHHHRRQGRVVPMNRY